MPKENIYQNILNRIIKSNNILLVSHQNPDGDAISSLCAFAELLEQIKTKSIWVGKYSLYCQDKPAKYFDYLPNFEKIISDKKINFSDFDLMISLDCGDIKRTGLVEEINHKTDNQFIIDIDHHPLIEKFADITLKDKLAISTTQIIYRIFKNFHLTINKEAANAILTGIITDSGNFLYPATNKEALTTASKMLSYGADLPYIIKQTSKNKSISAMRAWGWIMANLNYNKTYEIIFSIITKKEFDSLGASWDDLEGIVNFLGNVIQEGKMTLLLRQENNEIIKGSLRSNKKEIDVSKLANVLMGGGHKYAAGFSINGKIEKTNNIYKII